MTNIFLILLILLAFVVALGVVFLNYWPIYGAPFVPTENSEIKNILQKIGLKKGQVFCDLGCGDGRLVFEAVKITKTKAYGVDINWGLITWCRLQNNRLTKFYCQNIFNTELPVADVYYLYLWPGVVDDVAKKFEAEKRHKIKVVSKSFEVKHWRKYLKKRFVLNNKTFWIYQIP